MHDFPELTVADLAAHPRHVVEKAVRSRSQVVYLGDGTVLARVLGRYKMLLSTKDRGFACHVMMDGYWEMWLTIFFARLIRPGMTVVDVGANFGYYSLLFSDAVGPSGSVIAVEPVPTTAATLTETLMLNGFASRAQVVAKALTAKPDGTVHLVVPAGEPKNAAVVAQAGKNTVEVPATNFDELARDLRRCDLVKIDAEGSEAAILEGMQETIARFHPALLLEFNVARYGDAADFLSRLRKSFGHPHMVDFDGAMRRVNDKTVLTQNVGEDWLLYFPG
ncbi:MAG: FkbM family methyltransferase [Hyphomicrobiaceae bacterium]